MKKRLQRRVESKARIEAIFFDLGNVLICFDPRRAVRRLARHFGVSRAAVWYGVLTSRLERDYTKGRISSRDFFRRLGQMFPSRLSFREFSDHWNDIFWESEGMNTLVGRLAKRYPLYLISNTNELHFEFLKKHYPILRHFKKHFPSHEVGHRKPEPAIFRHALRKAGRRPENSVFIDDIPRFVKAAERLGMRGIRFRSKSQLERELRRLGVRWP